ncbi:Glycine cleavage system transcriptional activator [Burkholderiales bacterium]|nr:MAG: LysR family transcriptional regulator [Burkholderiales bacterium]CAG1006673.1 Glycine cleavage system transcriptional activator [Burkholderiales bacterium]
MNSPYRSLPPLDLLVAFEAAARHLSFTRAGAELFLTQSAVSRQIAAIEEALGTPLFRRRTRALDLTDAGRRLLNLAEPFLRDLRQYSESLRLAAATPRVRVTTTFGVAGVWLLPLLADFQARYPQIEVSIAADNRLADLASGEFDLAVRMCRGAVPEGARRLFGNPIAPVLCPVLARKHPVREVADLARHVFIHLGEEARWPWLSWQVWLERSGAAGLRPAGNLHLGQFDQVINAAIHGHGVALASLALVGEALSQGKLVAPLRDAGVERSTYYVLVAKHADGNPAVERFVAWLFQQAARAKRMRPSRLGDSKVD